jgi:hypothetical protein
MKKNNRKERRDRKGAAQVAQIINLPYRRIAFCGASAVAMRSMGSEALPIANRRYSRVQLCATSPAVDGRLDPFVNAWLRAGCPLKRMQGVKDEEE